MSQITGETRRFLAWLLVFTVLKIAIKVLTDLFSVLRLRSIDIQVLSDLEQVLGGEQLSRG